MAETVATCANACENCPNGSGWFSEQVYDSDIERLVLTDFRCHCRGVRCLPCELGLACSVTGEDYSDLSSSQFWDEGGAEDYARFDD